MKTISNWVLRGVSVLVAVAAGGMWVRSYFASDSFTWSVNSPNLAARSIHARALGTSPGRLIFHESNAFV